MPLAEPPDTAVLDQLIRERFQYSGHLPPGRTVASAAIILGTHWTDNDGAIKYETVIIYPGGPPNRYWLRGVLRRLQAALTR